MSGVLIVRLLVVVGWCGVPVAGCSFAVFVGRGRVEGGLVWLAALLVRRLLWVCNGGGVAFSLEVSLVGFYLGLTALDVGWHGEFGYGRTLYMTEWIDRNKLLKT